MKSWILKNFPGPRGFTFASIWTPNTLQSPPCCYKKVCFGVHQQFTRSDDDGEIRVEQKKNFRQTKISEQLCATKMLNEWWWGVAHFAHRSLECNDKIKTNFICRSSAFHPHQISFSLAMKISSLVKYVNLASAWRIPSLVERAGRLPWLNFQNF